MSSMKSSIRKKTFKRAKDILPDPLVSAIQKRRLEQRAFSIQKGAGSYIPSGSFTVVSAVYNAEPYLDDFFDSLINQTIASVALRIIAVDDGSIDGSAEVIRSWQMKYPGRITYIHKENGGQASARNLGIEFVDTDWVTFIDPDDFVSLDYFESVDMAARRKDNLRFASCNIIYFKEEGQRYQNSHPLKNRFSAGTRFYNVQDDGHPIQLSASAAFFRTDQILRCGLRFDESIRPNFEDGHFVNRYLISLTDGVIAFCAEPKYYYRKRASKSSTIDTSWLPGSGRLDIVPTLGYLSLLEKSLEEKGYVPYFIQNTVLYEISWYLKQFVGHPERASAFVKDGSGDRFLSSLRKIMEFIDLDSIERMSGGRLPFEWKYSLAKSYKQFGLDYCIVYVENIDLKKNQIQIRSVDPDLRVFFDGELADPVESHSTVVDLLGSRFLEQHRFRYEFLNTDQVLSASVGNGKRLKYSIRGKQYSGSNSLSTLISTFTSGWEKYPQNDSIWIIMDRDTQADDNGEHFYRYMAKHHPNQKCYFVLRKNSPDWARLSTEGFNLLDFGSRQHESILKRCSKIISSHADGYVHSYFGDNFLQSKDYVFLQHGVTKDDISSWINPKPISLLVTATRAEKNSIVKQGSHYSILPSRVALTGFPRHDRLLELGAENCGSSILIMPTWRKYLAGATKGKGNERELSDDFAESDYRIAWENLLSSDKLRTIAENTGRRIVFFPHANIFPYCEAGLFSIPRWVEIASNSEGESIQRLFSEAAVLITDYSSVAFEAAYLMRPCLYYQFDKEVFFSHEHVYSKGYFDYEADGFGPVAVNEGDLLFNLERIAQSKFEIQEPYRSRVMNTFPFRDGRCCERVYKAICAIG